MNAKDSIAGAPSPAAHPPADVPTAAGGPPASPDDTTTERAEAAGFRLASVGLAIVDLDGTLVRVNPAFAALHDRSPGQLVGQSVVVLNPDGDVRYRRPEARRVAIEAAAAYEFTSTPVDRPDRPLRYVLSVLQPGSHDGPDRLLLLEAAPDRGRADLLGPATVPQLVVDGDGTVVAASAGALRLLGRAEPGEVAGRPLASLLHPADGPVVEQLVGGERGRGDPGAAEVGFDGTRPEQPFEARVLRSDGALAWVSLQPDRVSLRERRPGATLVVLGDLTARKLDELLLHEAFDARPQPFVMVDATGRVLSANAAWRAHYGPLLRAASPGGDQLADLLDADGAAELIEQLQATAAGAQGFFEVHTLAAVTTLHPRALHLRASALHDLQGRVERVLVEFEDVTEPALEVEHARANAQRVRATVDLIDQAIATHDADGRVTEVNLGAHRMWGPGASDLVGERSLPGWWRPALADGSPLDDASHPAARVLAGPAPRAETTVQLTLPGGPPRWFVARARPVLEGTRRVGAVVTYTELTDQVAQLAAARDDGSELRDTFDALPLACYATDAALAPVLTNPAWDRLVEECGAHHLPDLLVLAHPADRAELGAAVDRVGAAGQPTELFHRLRRRDGATGWVHHRLAPRPLPDGRTAGVVGALLPVPEHVALGDRTRRLLNLVETSHDVVLEYDMAQARVTYLNPRARELFLPDPPTVGPGTGPDDVTRLDALEVRDLYAPDARELFRAEVWPALRERGRWEGELPMLTAQGAPIQVQQWLTAERDAHGRVVRLVAAGHDVTDRSQREAELALRATQDALTGLGNRALLLDHLELALARARRTGQLVALVFLDLDRFKSVNDRLGHDAGDQLLRMAAERVARAVRPGDTVVRIGGDEFVALCDGVDDAAHALRIADGIAAGVRDQLYDLGGTTLRATASVGVALSSGDDHPEALLRDADAAMYRAKDLGRARLELFDETMRSRASNRIQLTEELRHAVGSGAITVHYQPSIDLRTGRVRSVESLARWQHPERGLLQPGEFIGVADSSGLVLELGLEVLRQACRKARSWQDRWGAAAPRMHVNLSARQVADPALAALVAHVLAETGVDPGLICLEVTESILLDDSEATIEAICGLKDLGISIAIDDFGTGYSSLSYLSRLPVDVVKVDKSFVDDLDPADGDGPVVAAAIISLARTLGLATIAEGVTSVGQLAELHRLGCDAAQGYYFSPPLDARAIELYLERRLAADGDDSAPATG